MTGLIYCVVRPTGELVSLSRADFLALPSIHHVSYLDIDVFMSFEEASRHQRLLTDTFRERTRPVPTHILHHRLDKRRGDERCASVAFCGHDAPDVAPEVLWPERDPALLRQGFGALVADVRAFAADEAATCPECRQLRDAGKPGRLRLILRRIFGRAPEVAPLPDLLAESASEARHPEDDE